MYARYRKLFLKHASIQYLSTVHLQVAANAVVKVEESDLVSRALALVDDIRALLPVGGPAAVPVAIVVADGGHEASDCKYEWFLQGVPPI